MIMGRTSERRLEAASTWRGSGDYAARKQPVLEIGKFVIGVTASSPARAVSTICNPKEAAMITINSRVAIQAREWQRQYRKTNYGPVDFLFGGSKSRLDRVKCRLQV
jgi:hypothetical protein